jgi:hypothetical protein
VEKYGCVPNNFNKNPSVPNNFIVICGKNADVFQIPR